MKSYLKAWDFVRVLRLAIGLLIIAQSVSMHDWLFFTAGAFFTLMPILNIGCCGVSGCNIPTGKSNKNIEDVSYEEIR